MKIGIVSDTHGNVTNARAAADLLRSFEIELVIHCGDVGSVDVIGCFADWPTHFVFGNVDDPTVLADEIHAAGQTCHDRFGSISPADVSIAFLHGDDLARLDEAITSGRWKIVCHGHTHVARELLVGDTLVLNPGALHRAATKTIAIVDLPSRECEIVPI
jgi:hypothetical protein